MSKLILNMLNRFSSNYLNIGVGACEALYQMRIIPVIENGKVKCFESEIE